MFNCLGHFCSSAGLAVRATCGIVSQSCKKAPRSGNKPPMEKLIQGFLAAKHQVLFARIFHPTEAIRGGIVGGMVFSKMQKRNAQRVCYCRENAEEVPI